MVVHRLRYSFGSRCIFAALSRIKVMLGGDIYVSFPCPGCMNVLSSITLLHHGLVCWTLGPLRDNLRELEIGLHFQGYIKAYLKGSHYVRALFVQTNNMKRAC